MTSDARQLRNECDIFVRYLARSRAADYLFGKYDRAHHLGAEYEPRTRFDALVLRMVRRVPFLLPPADAFSRIFAPRSALRKKLVLTFALLETTSPFYSTVNDINNTSRPKLVVFACGHTLRWAMSFALGLIVFLPVRAFTGGPVRG